MAKVSVTSKTIAFVFVILTVSAIVGIVTMFIFYKSERSLFDPTDRPDEVTTTLAPPPVMRLPKSLIPHSYKIFLQPHLYTRLDQNMTELNQSYLFTGNSTVYFHCAEVTETIYLHSVDLTLIGEAEIVNRNNNTRIKPKKIVHHDEQTAFLEIQLEKTLKEGEDYSLFLAFKGTISQNLETVYVSTYQEGKPSSEGDVNTQRYLAATNLEPTFARGLFPCFDEPQMKAVFNVTIIHRRSTTALANEKATGTSTLDDEWQYTTFYPTPKMSTYLFAFTVSEFTSTSSPHNRVEINTFARPEAIKAGHTKYASSITGKILNFYENYLGIDYPQKTLDQIALPDLEPSAMENWGLVTYQEGLLLYEDGVSSLMLKQTIAIIIAHELAHQWFGNLVTMKWWNQIWLNEGFATYISPLAVDHVEPAFKIKDSFIMADLHTAFEEDALLSSHPLNPPENEVQTVYEIMQMFDTITYSKGAMVLRMLEDYVGESSFHKGIKTYLSQFKYNNTDQDDVWDCIQKAEGESSQYYDVAKMMKPWTDQIGYPVITINTINGEISQKHFLFNDSSDSSLWWLVPVRYMSNTSGTGLITLKNNIPEKKDELVSKSGDWILANVNCTGYYRVNYDPENWRRLMTQLETNPHAIPLKNRGQLIDDAFNLARAKLVDVTLALNSTRFLNKEIEYIPWESAVRNLDYFVLMFDRTEVFGPMQVYFRERVTVLYNSFSNYTNNTTIHVPEDQSLQQNQIIAIQLACSSGLPQCIRMASDMFALWMNGTNNIHPNLRSTIYCQAVAAGGKKEWEFAWNKLQSSSDTSEKEQLRQALSCTTHIWLLNRYLEYTLNPEKIRLMDVPRTINSIASNVAGHALAWNFIRAHWEYVKEGGAAALIEGVTSRFSKQYELEELQRFAKDNYPGSSSRAVNQAIEQTQINIQWVNDYKEIILEWFERQIAS